MSALFFREIAELDVLIEDLVAVILKKDVAFLEFAERRPNLVFADGNKLAPLLRAALEFHRLDAIQIEGDVHSLGEDAGVVPLADRVDLLSRRGGDQVVKRADGAIAIAAELGIWVALVVEDLEFWADG